MMFFKKRLVKDRFKYFKLFTLLIFGPLCLLSCHHPVSQHKDPDNVQYVRDAAERWKRELLVNGDVGTPCEEDEMKWIEKNPESYYGLPAEISSKQFDINQDGKEDLLLFFPAGESCTGGHQEGSDFVALIYSNGHEYLENLNLRAKIEQKLQDEFHLQTDTFARRAIFSIIDFKQQISGTFQLWTEEDPDCCASHQGIFKYNPLTWKIEIGEKKVLN